MGWDFATAVPSGPAVSAGTNIATSGTVVFANSNGISFGMATNNIITASINAAANAIQGVSAGTNQITSGTVVFANSNGFSFGVTGQSVTGSYTQSTAPGGIAAGTQTGTSGTVAFADSNGLTFGMSGSSQITASYSQSTAPAAISAGTTLASSGTIVLANSNNVSFGVNGNTVTATVAAPAYFHFSYPDQPTGSFPHSNAGMSLIQVPIPGRMTATQIALIGHMTGASNSTGGLSMSFGVYTMNGSTASLASSNSAFMSWASGTAATATNVSSAYGAYSGTQFRVVTLNSWALTPGNYLLALWFRSTNAGTWTWWGQSQTQSLVSMLLTSQTQFWLNGYSTSSFSTAMPASVNITDTGYVRTGASWNRQIGFALMGSV